MSKDYDTLIRDLVRQVDAKMATINETVASISGIIATRKALEQEQEKNGNA
jgi:hypothetical protein